MGFNLKLGPGVAIDTIPHPDVHEEVLTKELSIYKWAFASHTWYLLKLWDFNNTEGAHPYMIVGMAVNVGDKWREAPKSIAPFIGRVIPLGEDMNVQLASKEEYRIKDSPLYPRFGFIEFLSTNRLWFQSQFKQEILEPLGLTEQDFSYTDCSSEKSPIGLCRYSDDEDSNSECVYCGEIEQLPY